MSTLAKVKKKTNFDKVMDDFSLFAKNFLKIVDNNGELIPFVLNDEQEHFLANMGKLNVLTKSRQLGLSTMSIGICLWEAVRNPNTNYLIVSLDNPSAQYLFTMLKRMNEELPRAKYPGKFPSVVKDNKGEFILDNNTRITINSAMGDARKVGRGQTIRYAMLSEFAFYEPEAQKQILTSVEQSMAKNNYSKIVIESTANGMCPHYDLYMKAEKGQSSYKAFFYGYLSKGHAKQFKHEIDIAVEWYRQLHSGQRLSEKDLDEEEKDLFSRGATLNLLMWRLWKLSSMDKASFETEFPSRAIEAFKSTGANLFSSAKIIERLENAVPVLDKREIESQVPEALTTLLGRGLNMYYLPKRNVRYFGGVDVSAGVGQDNQAISIFDQDGVQVCTFIDNKTKPYELAEICYHLGMFYNQAKIGIEQNNLGVTVIERLRRDFGYRNMLKHNSWDKKGNKRKVLGWVTSAKTKGIMITDFREQFEKGLIIIHDRTTLEEMQIFVEKDGKYGNIRGAKNHDDVLIASMVAIQCMKDRAWYVNN